MIPTKEELKQKAKKGAEVLDKLKPTWNDKIDITILNMNNPNDCILGQLFGNYHKAKHHTYFCVGRNTNTDLYNTLYNTMCQLGFTVDLNDINDTHNIHSAYKEIISQLRDVWTELIKERR